MGFTRRPTKGHARKGIICTECIKNQLQNNTENGNMSHQTVFIMTFKEGKAISPFPNFMSKDIDKTLLTVLSVYAKKHFDHPVYFYLNVSLNQTYNEGPELQNICRIGYFKKDLFNHDLQPISLFINNISRALIITAKNSKGEFLPDFEGEMCIQIEGCADKL